MFENGALLIYTLQGVSSVANFITASEEAQLNRAPFSNLYRVICFEKQSFFFFKKKKKKIGPAVSEEKSFKGVDGRTDRRTEVE